jgi:hypothetical protein
MAEISWQKAVCEVGESSWKIADEEIKGFGFYITWKKIQL